MYPGVGVGNGIAGLGASAEIALLRTAARAGDKQFGINRSVKRKSVSSTRLFAMQLSIFSSTEAFKTIEANFDKVFRRTEQCTVIFKRLDGLTVSLQRYCT